MITKLRKTGFAIRVAVVVAAFFAVSPLVYAGSMWDDVKKLFQNRVEVAQHTKNVANCVKDLWRERKAISALNDSAMALVRAYHTAKQKGKLGINELLSVAQNAVSLINSYQRVAPVVEPVYNRMQPDLQYFSQMSSDFGDPNAVTNTFPPQTISDGRIKALSGSVGWARVWSTVADNPINIFKWGKLADEYKMGKAEGAYSLKCAQIAFEAAGFIKLTKGCLNDLMSVKNDIDGILAGNLNSILNLPTMGNRLMGATGNVDKMSEAINKAPTHFNNRFNELGSLQNDYVNVYKNYQQKYGTAQVAAQASSGTSSTVARPAMPATAPQANQGNWLNLQQATAEYAKAYREYLAAMDNPNTPPEILQVMVNKLNQAQRQVEAARAAQSTRR